MVFCLLQRLLIEIQRLYLFVLLTRTHKKTTPKANDRYDDDVNSTINRKKEDIKIVSHHIDKMNSDLKDIYSGGKKEKIFISS